MNVAYIIRGIFQLGLVTKSAALRGIFQLGLVTKSAALDV